MDGAALHIVYSQQTLFEDNPVNGNFSWGIVQVKCSDSLLYFFESFDGMSFRRAFGEMTEYSAELINTYLALL